VKVPYLGQGGPGRNLGRDPGVGPPAGTHPESISLLTSTLICGRQGARFSRKQGV